MDLEQIKKHMKMIKMGRNNDYIKQLDNIGTETIGIEEGTNTGVREDITTSTMGGYYKR